MVEVPSRGYQPIENYGVIGDLYTVALVGMDGSIDFFAFPHFDSPTVFAALLDHAKGGRFQIAPQLTDARQKQLYLPDSNILLTRFLAAEGVAEISDFMPVEEVEQAHNLVRRVKTVRGELCFRMLCAPRFDYARASHRVEQQEGRLCFFPLKATIVSPCACTVQCHFVFIMAMPSPSLPCGLMSTLSLSWSGPSPGQPRRRQRQTMSRAASRIPLISGAAGLGAQPTRAAGGRWSTAQR